MAGSGFSTELFQERKAVNGYVLGGAYLPGVRTPARISPFDDSDIDPFSARVVPVVKGRLTRPEVSDWSSMEEPGGTLKLNEYCHLHTYSNQLVSVPVAVGGRKGDSRTRDPDIDPPGSRAIAAKPKPDAGGVLESPITTV